MNVLRAARVRVMLLSDSNDGAELRSASLKEAMNARVTQFPTTRWSLVLAAGESQTVESRQALEELCRAYWYPLYAYVRRRGHDVEESRDLTQEFFFRLCTNQLVRAADRGRGRFRSYLIKSFNNFLNDEWKKARALKRGGNWRAFSLDALQAEERYRFEPVDHLTPDQLYDRRWALILIQKAMDRLEEEQTLAGKGDLFRALKPHLTGDAANGAYSTIAVRFRTTEAGAKMSATRLRQRFAVILRAELAETVGNDPRAVEEELETMMAALDPARL